jgi:hypothetical protein
MDREMDFVVVQVKFTIAMEKDYKSRYLNTYRSNALTTSFCFGVGRGWSGVHFGMQIMGMEFRF